MGKKNHKTGGFTKRQRKKALVKDYKLLTTKQLEQPGVKDRFDMFVANMVSNGLNGALAVRETPGYADGCARQTANRLMSIDYVKQGVKEALAKEKAKNIATKQERQEWWTRVMLKESEIGFTGGDRLRASELLGKSECDFIERTINLNADIPTDPDQYKSWLVNELKRLEGNAELENKYKKAVPAIAKRY